MSEQQTADQSAAQALEWWWVRVPGAVALSQFYIQKATEKTVTVVTDGWSLPATYARADLEFVEKIR